jgi:hypothetical protein
VEAPRALFLIGVLGLAVAGGVGWWSSRPRPEPVRESRARTDPEPVPQVEPPPIEPGHEPAPPPPVAPVEPPRSSRFSAINLEAIGALGRREFELAIELFEQCVEGEPDEPVFKGNLAEALARRAIDEHDRTRPCAPCVEWLERAVGLAPDREPLQKLLERWKAELTAESDFQRDRSVHFELSYDGWRDVLLRAAPDVLDELERHYIDLSEYFGIHPAERGAPRIPVVLYRREQFDRITGLADWAGGSYDGTVRVPIADGRGLDAALSGLLRHELVHAFVRASGGLKVPAWLNEGLAQWLQPDAGGALTAARRALVEGEFLPLERLEKGFASLGDPPLVARAYAQSLAFVEFLERRHGRACMPNLVSGCASGKSVAESFEAWAHITLAVALEDFRADLGR